MFIKADVFRSTGRTPEEAVRLNRALDSESLRALSTKPEADRTYRIDDSIHSVKPPLIAHLEAGRQREAAQLMAAYPEASRVTLEADRAERVLLVDRCLKLHRFAEALDELEAATSVHGDHFALLVQRGLAEIGRGRPERALEVLNKIGHEQDPQPLMTEINRRLRGKPSPQEPAAYLLSTARIDAGRSLSAHKEGAEFAAVLDQSGKVVVEATLSETELGAAKLVGVKNLTDNAIIYLDDSFGYHNLDRNPDSYKSLHQAIEGGTAELLELYGPALRVKPDRIRFQKNPSGGSESAGSRMGLAVRKQNPNQVNQGARN